MVTRKKIQTSLLLLVLIIILVNIVSNRFFFRLDFTSDQRYSLSQATKDILNSLDEPVTVTAYFSENLPPDIERVRTDFKDLLVEYSNRSNGQLVYEFVNPSENEESEAEAQQKGISPIMINVRERDQIKQQRAYLGAIVQMGDKKEIIPLIQPGAAMEYALSTSIKKISISVKPKIALLQGSGEPTLSSLQQFQASLDVMYDITTVELSDTSGIPDNIKTLVIISPKDTMPSFYFNYLDEFINKGGRIFAAINAAEGILNEGRGEEVYTGLNDWLKGKGIEIENNMVIDINCGNVMMRQQSSFGGFVMNTPVSFPYLPIISNFADHPITKGLESVLMPFVSSIKFTPKDTSVVFIPLAVTSEKAGMQPLPIYFNVTKEWTQSDFPLSSIPVAVAVEGNLNGTAGGKMVVISDGDFLINGEGQNARQLQPDNISLAVNAIDWLSDDTGLAELRTKGVTSRPIDPSLEEGTKTLLKYLNFLLPILLIIGYGIVRFQMKRNIKNKLIQTSYVQQ